MPCIDFHTHAIDFHTHAFPDNLAPRAVGTVADKEKAGFHFSDGTVKGLLSSMDSAGIDAAVICSIATKPGQVEPILSWSQSIRSERIIPLPSVHPQDENLLDHVRQVHDRGFLGIKMHPYYQDFVLDDPALFPLYEELARLGLLLVMHTGFDSAFPGERRSDPEKTLALVQRFPNLKLIATHLGVRDDWDEVERLLLGKPVYMELSFAAVVLPPERFKRMLLAHPAEYLLFGTDSPWTDQKKTLETLRALHLPDELFARITFDNAARLLGM